MTFSIAARCNDTGMLGVAVSSSSICVASRCAFVRAGVGAALSQNVTDPRLGPRMLDLLVKGGTVRDAVDQLALENTHIAYRQLGLVDGDGNTAHFSGAETLGRHAAASGAGCVSIGNLLANEEVPKGIVDTFERSSGPLAARLIEALNAGLEAGGEAGAVHSAGVLVADREPWPIVDLRVDWEDLPIERLMTLWQAYQPQLEDYRRRALNPATAPSYGVPGDDQG